MAESNINISILEKKKKLFAPLGITSPSLVLSPRMNENNTD